MPVSSKQPLLPLTIWPVSSAGFVSDINSTVGKWMAATFAWCINARRCISVRPNSQAHFRVGQFFLPLVVQELTEVALHFQIWNIDALNHFKANSHEQWLVFLVIVRSILNQIVSITTNTNKRQINHLW